MSKPAARILATLELLQSRQRVTGASLADELQVDRRTVRRYITALEEMGIPILAERGRDGAYTLARGFKLPPMMFTNDEAIAVGTGLLAARQLGLVGAGSAGASAQAKLERSLPDKLRQRLRAISETVALDMREQHSRANAEVFAVLAAASERQQRVQIAYQTREQVGTRRAVNPYALAFYRGHWYVVGWCHLRREMRSFRLDRIVDAESLPATFARPPHFDVLAFLRNAVATLPRAHSVVLTIAAPIDDVRPRLFAELGVLEAASEGTRLTSEVDDLDWLARELSRLPFSFRVDKPQPLKLALKRHAAKLAICAAG